MAEGILINPYLDILFATLTVNFPDDSGATVSCNNSYLNLSPISSTDTSAIFSIPYKGAWTITLTDGISTKSKTVDVINEGKNINVEIFLKTYFYTSNPSNQHTDITGGWTCDIRDDHGNLTFTDNYMQLYVYAHNSEIYGWDGTAYTVNPVFISGNTLEFVVTVEGHDYSGSTIGISSSGGNNRNYLAKKSDVSSGTHTIDVSNFVGQSVYICVSADAGSIGGNIQVRVISIKNY